MDAPPVWLLIAAGISVILYKFPTWRLRWYQTQAEELDDMLKEILMS